VTRAENRLFKKRPQNNVPGSTFRRRRMTTGEEPMRFQRQDYCAASG